MIKKYDKYKKTNFDLLEMIPIGWSLQKIKFMASIYNGDSLNDDFKIQFESYNQDELAYISSKDIDVDTSKVQYDNGLRIPKEQQKFKIAPANSTLLCIEGGSAGRKIAFINQDVFFVNKLACFNIQNPITSKYLYYSLKADIFQAQFKNSITGMIGGVSISNLKNFYLAFPSIEDQSRVVNFLDHQTSIIDQLIQQKEKLFELLKEKRQAVINEAVTKGLNPNAKMKDIGIEWLGKVPADWDLVPLKHLGTIKYGLGQPPKYKEGGLPLIRATNVERGKIVTKDLVFVDPDDVPFERDPVLRENDIIVVRSGAYTADSAIIPKEYEGAITGYDMVIRAEKVHPKLLAFSLLSYYLLNNQLFLKRMRSAQPHLNAEELGESFLLLPPQKQQTEIVTYLEYQVGRIEDLGNRIIEAISKLKEFRQSIISEVVTGKIDVRNWQPNKQQVA